MKRICVLGSTGSIGTQALSVVENLGFSVTAVTAHKNVKLLEQQVRKFSPAVAVVTDEQAFKDASVRLKDTSVNLMYGMESVCEVASSDHNDILLNSLVGMRGLKPTMCAIEAGVDIALANKETLVTGGKLVMDAVKKHNVRLLPVDSEHSAIFQCLQGRANNHINKIILTASGGPFFGKKYDELEKVTVKEALNHPNWNMGAKITIDSATLMNKGLELIEAVWLFDKAPQDIEIVVHRESVVHSLVEYDDFSVIAQLGVPDMRIPIQYALTYPDRTSCDVNRLSLSSVKNLSFYEPDEDTFKCLTACKLAISKGGLYPTYANGANEKAVELFLDGRIGFNDIGRIVLAAVEEIKTNMTEYTIEDIYAADAFARNFAENYL